MESEEIIVKYDESKLQTKYMNFSLIPDKVSLQQYFKTFFRNSAYLKKFWNSILLTFPTVIIQTTIAFIAAYAFAKFNFPGRHIIFVVILVLMLLPIQVTLVPNYMVLDFLKLLNTYRGIIYTGIFAPLALFLLRQYLRYIPNQSIDAAMIDGAGHVRIMLSIILPQAKGGVAAVAILSFIDNWNMVEQPLAFLSNKNMYPLSIFMSQFISNNFGAAFSAGIIFMIPAVIIFLLGEEYIIL
ncbi:MAG: carbohydrate ABC transporter permease, partial [Clostridiales bacterium]|nr:carbohydrate ABC transporter permease [Clostridiales bacterium]